MARKLLLPVAALCGFARLSPLPTIFANEEIRIEFRSAFAVRDKPGVTQYPRHLPQPLRSLDFCPWQPQPPDVQQVMRPESGYLCELHILPAQAEKQALEQVTAAHAADTRKYARNLRLEATDIGSHRVIRWRLQMGKTRLDHFLLIGKRYNYLFVSSPYGSHGALEKVIEEAKFFPS
ncbi:MAG: hypothetical protein U1F40_03360 [Turneriella sp.]